MTKEINVFKKNGEIHNSCPHIDNILELCSKQEDIISQIKEELERVRKINEELRKSNNYDKGKEEVWDEVSDIVEIRRCDARDLKKFCEERNEMERRIDQLEDENDDLLKQIRSFDDA